MGPCGKITRWTGGVLLGTCTACGSGLTYMEKPRDTSAPVDSSDSPVVDTSETEDPGPTAITVHSVSPSYGTTAGGSQVVIRGGPFDRSAVVTFAGWTATILEVTPDDLTVETPANDVEGPVDVSIQTNAGSGILQDGFTYWADGTGRYGSFGFFVLEKMLGTYWSDTSDAGFAWVYFASPFAWKPSDFFGTAPDTCRMNHESLPEMEKTYRLGVDAITLSVPDGTDIRLPYNSTFNDFEAYNQDFRTSAYIPGGAYDLETVHATDLPTFAMASILQAPDDLVLTRPDLGGSEPPTFAKGDIRFDWNGSPGSFVSIQLCNSPTQDGVCASTFDCLVRDDGSFTVPAADFSPWPRGNTVFVYLTRWEEPTGIFPFNNAKSGFLGGYEVIGIFVAGT